MTAPVLLKGRKCSAIRPCRPLLQRRPLWVAIVHYDQILRPLRHAVRHDVLQPQDIAHDLAEDGRGHSAAVIGTIARIVHHHHQRELWSTGGRHAGGIGHILIDIFAVRADFLRRAGFTATR